MSVPRFLLLFSLSLALCGNSRAGALDDVLRLSSLGAGPADSTHAAALRLLVDAGQAAGGAEASTWDWLDLWLAAEWERDLDLPARQERFLKKWPHSRYAEDAQLLLARWWLRQAREELALPLLLDLGWRLDAGPGRQEVMELLRGRCQEALVAVLADSTMRDLHPGRARVLDELSSPVLRRRLDVVAPLSGEQAQQGKELLAGVQAAVAQAKGQGHTWTLTARDSQGDGFLARELATKARDEGADVLLVSWDPASLLSMGGLQLGIPILTPGNGGPPLRDLSPDLLQLDLDPGALGSVMADFVRDSLRAASVGVLAPATPTARRLLRSLLGKLQGPGGVECGQEQWYFPGARDLRGQAENLALFTSAYDGPGVWVLLGQEAEAEALRRLVEETPSGITLVGDAALLSALGGKAPSRLAGRLFVLTGGLPSSWAREAGLIHELDSAFPADTAPSSLRSRSFESARVALWAAEEGARKGLGIGASLVELELPSSFGASLMVREGCAAGAWLLAWNGEQFTCVGGRLAVER